MKNARLASTLILVATLAGGAAAQGFGKEMGDVRGTALGIRAGAQITFIDDGYNDAMVGFHLGAVRDIVKLTQFSTTNNSFALFFRTGAQFLDRPHLWNGADMENDDTRLTLWMEVPALLSLKRQSALAYGLFGMSYRIEAGPYAQFGLLGKFERSLEDGTKESMNRLDAGLALVFAIEIGLAWVAMDVNLGYMDVYSGGDAKSVSANHLKFTVGWDF